ncbi:MAG TPA: FG-GAP-like repeat-containing protein [Verrucomicrobiae bacterium]|nr:FG-GAP-like repeat-containing protein [Verrucomicrobiae bacterium]
MLLGGAMRIEAAKPTVHNLDSDSLSGTSISVTASIDPKGLDTSVRVFYNTDSSGSYTTWPVTSSTLLPGSHPEEDVTITLTGLAVATTYYYVIEASNADGATHSIFNPSSDFNYPLGPFFYNVDTGSPGQSTVEISGYIDPTGADTTVYVEYSTDLTFNLQSTQVILPGAGSSHQLFDLTLTGLNPLTTYHYRVRAENSDGINYSSTNSFFTFGPGPLIESMDVTPGATSADFTGSVDPNGNDATVLIEYSTDLSFDHQSSSDSLLAAGGSQSFNTITVTGLTPSTTYHYRVKAENSDGINYSSTNSFTTTTAGPLIDFVDVSTDATSATFTGHVDPNGSDATLTIEYSTDLTFSLSYASPVTLLDVDGDQSFNITVTGLTPATLYHFRLAAANNDDTSRSANDTFKTKPFTDSGNSFPDALSPGNDDFSFPNPYQMAPQAAAWADMDGDGDLDLILTGSDDLFTPITQIWENNGDGTFTQRTGTGLPDVTWSAVAWGDVDNDNRPDLAISGVQCSCQLPSVLIYHNNGDFTFSPMIDLGAGGAQTLAWGDYNNDGKLDLLVSGSNVTDIWQNLGGGGFVQINAGFTGTTEGGASFGDYDNDGWLDVIQTGWQSTDPVNDPCGCNDGIEITKLWHNAGDGTFTEATTTTFSPVSGGTAQWADFNNDGQLDVLLQGVGFDDPSGLETDVAEIWYNQGGGVFLKQPQVSDPATPLLVDSGIPGYVGAIGDGVAVTGDLDNNGTVDIVKAGFSNASFVSPFPPYLPFSFDEILNNGDRTYNYVVNDIYPAKVPVYSSVALGDYDNDGRLDMVILGLDYTSHSGENITKVVRNLLGNPNTPPNSPSNPQSVENPTTMTLSWDAASDTETPPAGLTYNVRVGTAPGASPGVSPNDTVPSQSLGTGYRLIPQRGNAQNNLFFTFTKPPRGHYYWSVQAVDSAFAGSAFSADGQFDVLNQAPVAGDDHVQRAKDQGFTISEAKLLSNDVDPDNSGLSTLDVLFISAMDSTSAHGGTIDFICGTVTYTPDPGYNGPDSFTYTVNDGNGGTSIGTVLITVRDVNADAGLTITGIDLSGVSPNEIPTIHFAGVPGRTYTIEFTHALGASASWGPPTGATPVTVPAGANGKFDYTDNDAPGNGPRFYRAVQP